MTTIYRNWETLEAKYDTDARRTDSLKENLESALHSSISGLTKNQIMAVTIAWWKQWENDEINGKTIDKMILDLRAANNGSGKNWIKEPAQKSGWCEATGFEFSEGDQIIIHYTGEGRDRKTRRYIA